MSGHTELDFESAIEHGLIYGDRYQKRAPDAFDPATALFPDDVIGFIRDKPARTLGPARSDAERPHRGDRDRQPDQGAGQQRHARRPSPWLQVLRQGVPPRLLPAQLGHEPGERCAVRCQPADHHAPGRLHLRTCSNGRTAPRARASSMWC